MQKKLRIRRLTLAPKPLSAVAVSNDNLMIEADRILDYERHHRDMELVVASSSRSKPHVHGKEIGRNNRLWAGSYAFDSDSEIDEPVIVPDNAMLPPVPPVTSAEKDVKGELGTYPVKAFAHHNDVKQVNSNDSHMKPWEGPLPSRRVSPQLAFHHVLEKALTCRDSSRSVPSVHREKCVQDGCTLSGASVSAKIGNIIQKSVFSGRSRAGLGRLQRFLVHSRIKFHLCRLGRTFPLGPLPDWLLCLLAPVPSPAALGLHLFVRGVSRLLPLPRF